MEHASLSNQQVHLVTNLMNGQDHKRAAALAGYRAPSVAVRRVLEHPLAQLTLAQWRTFLDRATRARWAELLEQDRSLDVSARMVEIGAKTAGWYQEGVNVGIIQTEFSELSREDLEARIREVAGELPSEYEANDLISHKKARQQLPGQAAGMTTQVFANKQDATQGGGGD
jgi:hypothetical protein